MWYVFESELLGGGYSPMPVPYSIVLIYVIHIFICIFMGI